MCVRVTKWREDAQPEWPEPASATGEVPVAEGEAQTFPETGGTEVLEGGRAPGPGSGRRIRATPEPAPGSASALAADPAPAAETEVLRPAAGGVGRLRDPWGEPGATDPSSGGGADPFYGRTDPYEVAVRLDDIGPRPEEPAKGGNGHDGSEGPVFIDASGRRSRRLRRIGMAIGIACAVYALVIVVTLLSGSSDAPWLPVPGQKDDHPAGKVDSPPLPPASVRPGAGGGVPSGSRPTAGDGTAPSPGASASAPGASATPRRPSTSADPRPTATGSPTGPGGGGATVPVVQPPSSPPASSPPGPTPSDSAASPDPSPSAGTGTVADAPGSPAPVAEEPAVTAPDLSAPSSPGHLF